MDISLYLDSDSVWLDVPVRDKRAALRFLAEKAARKINVASHKVLEALSEREGVCSTATGKGVAAPHCRLKGLNAKVWCAFLRAETPLDFDSFDRQPTDLMFLIVSCENAGADHLRLLAKFARLAREERIRAALRAVQLPQEAVNVLTAE